VSFIHLRALFKLEPRWENPVEFAVLVVLADFANREGQAWPSKPTIAKRVRLSVKQVGRVVRALEQRGLLYIEPGKAARGGNLYTLLFEPLTVDTHVHGEQTGTVDTHVQGHDSATVDAHVHRLSVDGVLLAPPTVDMERATVDTGVPSQWTPVSPNPTNEPVLRDPEYRTSAEAPARAHSQADADRIHSQMIRVKDLASDLPGDFSSKEQLAAAVRERVGEVDEDAFATGISFAWTRRKLGGRRPSTDFPSTDECFRDALSCAEAFADACTVEELAESLEPRRK
jgi:hypothetical protein